MKTTFKALAGAVLAMGAFNMPTQVVAANPVEECSKELLLSYFPEALVKETLKKFNVPEAKWDAIVKDLNAKDKDIVKIVEDKASKQNPNPLKDPQQRQAAVKIFRETLLETFSGVMKKNGVTDDSQIQQMLDDVQQQKAKRFAQCMEQQRAKPSEAQSSVNGAPQAANDTKVPPTQPQTAAPNASTVSDDLDADDDDEDDL